MKKILRKLMISVVVMLIVLLGLKLYSYKISLLWIWLVSLAVGYVIHRSGICFSSAVSDSVLFRNFEMARATLIMMLVSLLGISPIQYQAVSNGLDVPGRFASLGLHTIVGSLIFGFGMILAGACGLGTLQRIGEGFLLYIFVLIGILVGSVFGAYHFEWWAGFKRIPAVFLPDLVGWSWSVTLSVLALGILYICTILIEKKFFTIERWWTYDRKNTGS